MELCLLGPGRSLSIAGIPDVVEGSGVVFDTRRMPVPQRYLLLVIQFKQFAGALNRLWVWTVGIFCKIMNKRAQGTRSNWLVRAERY